MWVAFKIPLPLFKFFFKADYLYDLPSLALLFGCVFSFISVTRYLLEHATPMPENSPFLLEIAFSERVAFREVPSPNSI